MPGTPRYAVVCRIRRCRDFDEVVSSLRGGRGREAIAQGH